MHSTTIFKNSLSNLIRENINSSCKTEHDEYSQGKFKIFFDIYLEHEDKIVIIEIEFRRADPINNLIKILHWCSYSSKKKKIMLIHVYDKSYYSLKENETKLFFTKFVGIRGKLLHKNLSQFKYRQLGIDIDEKMIKKSDKYYFEKLAYETFLKIRNHLV
jgi:hypothetical protein